MRKILILLVRAYQIALSPLLGQRCRFYPSCSNYWIAAIQQHGCLKGVYLGIVRICKCHPWHPGGYDPVPKRDKDRSPTGPIGYLVGDDRSI